MAKKQKRKEKKHPQIYHFTMSVFANQTHPPLTTQLDSQRLELETESFNLRAELETCNIGPDEKLIDDEGYPRADVDVHRIRILRNRLAIVNTDHKAIMRQIEAHVLGDSNNTAKTEDERRSAPKPKPKYDAVRGAWVVQNWDGSTAGIAGGEGVEFSDIVSDKEEAALINLDLSQNSQNSQQQQQQQQPLNEFNGVNQDGIDQLGRPFSTVESVEISSPAAECLFVGDQIVHFGSVSKIEDFKTGLPGLVQSAAAARKGIELIVIRGEQRFRVELRPRPWAGRGLIGAYILPILAN